ncbi:hypothetical protein NQ318_012407 [Aromia moschata]|uniref:Adult-specific cuticular protein ACP-20 n=1 Tax=Aromia moschata TaxID=1265417 RepID=A0AAV8Y622_9CUCU|nr:hypothetical protein NQ318_012407 [Aromia moschata]
MEDMVMVESLRGMEDMAVMVYTTVTEYMMVSMGMEEMGLAFMRCVLPPDGHAHYKFGYGVHDPHTGDSKSQEEHRKGDHVTGGYAVQEPDGTQRIVKYKSGPHTGFEAVVERVGVAHHPARYGHGKHGQDLGGVGGTSYVTMTNWGNQGQDKHGYY